MKYRLVVFDVDGTIMRHISSWRYIHERLGLRDVLARRYQEQFLAGRISYRRFCELDAAYWKGIESRRLQEIFQRMRYSKNARRAIKRLKELGFKLAAISTGLQFATDRIKRELKFDYAISNRLNIRNGRLTGGVTININHGAKGKIVRAILKRFGVKAKEMLAVGDSEGDIAMARLAGYSIAFNSSSEELSRIVDYDCKSDDFMEVYHRIVAAAGV